MAKETSSGWKWFVGITIPTIGLCVVLVGKLMGFGGDIRELNTGVKAATETNLKQDTCIDKLKDQDTQITQQFRSADNALADKLALLDKSQSTSQGITNTKLDSIDVRLKEIYGLLKDQRQP